MKPILENPAVFQTKFIERDGPSQSRIDDEALATRLKMRDKTALNDLLEQHGAMMYGVAMRLMRNEDAAREVIQDALIAVWNKGDSYRGQAKLSTWLYRVTANAAVMQLRK